MVTKETERIENPREQLCSMMTEILENLGVPSSSINGFMRHFRDAPNLYGSIEGAEKAFEEYQSALERIPSKRIPEYLRTEVRELEGLRNASPIGIRLRAFAYEDIDREDLREGRLALPTTPHIDRSRDEMSPWQENALRYLEGD